MLVRRDFARPAPTPNQVANSRSSAGATSCTAATRSRVDMDVGQLQVHPRPLATR